LKAASTLFSRIMKALSHARFAILSAALIYFLGLLIGITMVHTGSSFALSTRDNIVNTANTSSSISQANNAGAPVKAALLDFGSNLLLGAVPSTVVGLGIIIPYPLMIYRGWVGGIVSVDGQHASRLAHPGSAIYYIVTLILQLIPYVLAGGIGIHLGIDYYRTHSGATQVKWWKLPNDTLLDVAYAYMAIVPLFLIASLWEFLAQSIQ
jgi:hypothetical protein